MTFEESVTQFIRMHGLIRRGMRLLVGVSGGADSMALLCFFLAKRREWALQLAACSVDHQLRGQESQADLQYVAAFCTAHHVPFFGRTVDAAALAKREKLSVEASARLLRYQAFREVAATFRADAIALAHHGDDQVETMLMHQVRGSAGMAKAGIPIRRPFADCELIRPFLTHTKRELEEYCRQQRIQPRNDPSNQSDAHTRNRFRKYVLPFLKEENPLVHLKFQYESERLAEDEAFLLAQAETRMNDVILCKNKHEITLSVTAFLSSHSPLQRRIIHLILTYLYNGQGIKPLHQSIHIENLLHLLRSGRASGSINFPGNISALLSYEQCRIGRLEQSAGDVYSVPLLIPGETVTPAGLFLAGPEDLRETHPAADHFLISMAQLSLPLSVRTWRLGDRMAPNGMDGTQKVQRLFINEKIARDKRKIWPLLVDADGAILWLPMLRKARLPQQTRGAENQADQVLITFHPAAKFGRI